MSGGGQREPGALTPDDVRRIAELAALELTDDEVDRLAGELTDILDHFASIRAAEGAEDAEDAEGAEDAEDAESAGPQAVALRPDEPGPDPLARPPEADAPGFEDGFFTVPRLQSHVSAAVGEAEDAEDAEDAGA